MIQCQKYPKKNGREVPNLGQIFETILVGPMKMFIGLFYEFTQLIGLPNYGLAIILFTIVLKILLYPLTVKQIRGMKKMQDLQPKMKAIQDKYKDNKELLQQKMMEFYKENNFNPLAGCLPLLAQMPILIAIFYAIREFEYLVTPAFLYLENIANPDPFYVLPVISAVTTWITTKQSQAGSPSSEGAAAQQQKIMLWFMPAFIGYISLSFPAGLVLYWSMNNIIQIAQQGWLMRQDNKKA